MSALLVDARPLSHPTAGGRGIGNYVAGLIGGLAEIGADVTALLADERDRALLPETVPDDRATVLSRPALRERIEPGTWFVATGMFLHPIPLDPIPAAITEGRVPVASIMYDVIPYRYPERYLVEENAQRLARLRAVLARTADLHLSISDFVARTAVDVLGIDPARMVTIGAAANDRFVPAAAGSTSPIDEPYVVAVTGGDARKNTETLLDAWSRVAPTLRATHRLVVVASPPPSILAAWHARAGDLGVADRVTFAAGLDDAAVVRLLQHARLDVVASIDEGFGLPALEGAACGVPVICSGTSSLPEVIDDPAAHFDPHDPDAIAAAIDRALVDDTHRDALLAAGRRAVDRWSWSLVATDAVAAIERARTDRADLVRATRAPQERVAVVDADTARVDDVELPAMALGRYLKRHDFDRIVTLSAAETPAG